MGTFLNLFTLSSSDPTTGRNAPLILRNSGLSPWDPICGGKVYRFCAVKAIIISCVISRGKSNHKLIGFMGGSINGYTTLLEFCGRKHGYLSEKKITYQYKISTNPNHTNWRCRSGCDENRLGVSSAITRSTSAALDPGTPYLNVQKSHPIYGLNIPCLRSTNVVIANAIKIMILGMPAKCRITHSNIDPRHHDTRYILI